MSKLKIINILILASLSACSLSTFEKQQTPKYNTKLALQALLLSSRSDLPVPNIGTPYKDVLDLLDKRNTKIIEISENLIKVKSQSRDLNTQQLKQVGTFVYIFENGALVSGPNFHSPDINENQ